MSGVSKLVTEEVVISAKEKLKQIGKAGYLATKLQAVIATKEHGIQKVAEVFGVSRVSLTNWIKHVKNNQTNRLVLAVGRGRRSKLSQKQKETIQSWISDNHQITIDQVKQKIASSFGVELGRSTVHRIMKSLDFSYITPRPQHNKQNTSLHEEFKKKSSP